MGLLRRANTWITHPPDSIGEEVLGDYAITSYAMLLGLICHGFFLAISFALGETFLAQVNIGSVSIFIVAPILTRRGWPKLALTLGSIELVVHAWLATTRLGWASNFQVYLFLLGILWFPIQSVSRFQRIVLAFSPIGVYIALYDWTQTSSLETPATSLSAGMVDGLARLNMVQFVLVMVGAFGSYLCAAIQRRRFGRDDKRLDPFLNLGVVQHSESETQRIRTVNVIGLIGTAIATAYTLSFAVLGWLGLSHFQCGLHRLVFLHCPMEYPWLYPYCRRPLARRRHCPFFFDSHRLSHLRRRHSVFSFGDSGLHGGGDSSQGPSMALGFDRDSDFESGAD